jgi:hypothetical protein
LVADSIQGGSRERSALFHVRAHAALLLQHSAAWVQHATVGRLHEQGQQVIGIFRDMLGYQELKWSAHRFPQHKMRPNRCSKPQQRQSVVQIPR